MLLGLGSIDRPGTVGGHSKSAEELFLFHRELAQLSSNVASDADSGFEILLCEFKSFLMTAGRCMQSNLNSIHTLKFQISVNG